MKTKIFVLCNRDDGHYLFIYQHKSDAVKAKNRFELEDDTPCVIHEELLR